MKNHRTVFLLCQRPPSYKFTRNLQDLELNFRIQHQQEHFLFDMTTMKSKFEFIFKGRHRFRVLTFKQNRTYTHTDATDYFE